MENGKRKLVDITLEEAVEVLKLGEGFESAMKYQLRKKENPWSRLFAQLYYIWDNKEVIAANFSDNRDAIMLCRGNHYYRTYYRITKYLEGRGFDLQSADSTT